MSPRKAHLRTSEDNPYAEEAGPSFVALKISYSSLANEQFNNLQLNSECINAFPGNYNVVFYVTAYM